jgi:hypothetical protein
MFPSVSYFIKALALVGLFTYGMFYMSYKFGQPHLGNSDFFKYEKMVDSPFNFRATTSPFITRQLPAAIASFIKQAGIFYPNKIVYTNSGFQHDLNSQKNFFALILSNYLAFICSIAIIISYLKKLWPQKENAAIYFPVLALSLGYFIVPLNVVAPLCEGYAWLAGTLLTIGLLERKVLLSVIGILIALFSRESLIILFAAMLFFKIAYDLTRQKKDGFLITIFICLLFSFGLYLLMRTNLTTGHEHQLSGNPLTKAWAAVNRNNIKEYVFQNFIVQGLLLYLAYHLYRISKFLFAIWLGSMLVLTIVGTSSGPGIYCVGRLLGESYCFLMLVIMVPASKLDSSAFRITSTKN